MRRTLVASVAALALPVVVGGAQAQALPAHGITHRMNPGATEDLMVPSSMGPIKVQVQWARNGGNGALYMLDGMAARDDRNAWSFETNAMQQFANDDITLVMPVGGQSSFYTDWLAPSNTNGQKFTYKWETFLTKELPAFLEGYGVSRTNNAVVGLSMSGGAALALAAFHRDQFKYAGSYSGALNVSAPGMREALRVAVLRWGAYNIDSMAPPWSPQWLRMDPFVFAPQLRGLPMHISAGGALPGEFDRPSNVGAVFDTGVGMGIEAVCLVNTRSFQARLAQLGIQAEWDFPATGTHSWKYWEAELWKSRIGILTALHAI
ncbi:alpha/beta hydrolase [Nocardia tengchongensis]|uniref:Esterase family protein n=1 Tax=Nocardia tengchongensis TaxID=2055889 RepID=A0ABX8CU89_9NOCA|nr:alpha/beta hydrolase family protein [Nocardia tengchongensis]QVI22703.1 esterase family protein [Nocardia tengchongensis]